MPPGSSSMRIRFVLADGLRLVRGKASNRLRRAALRSLVEAGCGPEVYFHAFQHEGVLYGLSARLEPERGRVVVELGLLPPGLRPRTIPRGPEPRERQLRVRRRGASRA
jgi:hypothetical protein